MSDETTPSPTEGPKSSSSAIKTPVSILQELYVRKGITPKYDLVQIEGAVHEPTFKYRVTVGNIIATGCGQSKKKAKHMAAKAVLEKLQQSAVGPTGDSAGQNGAPKIELPNMDNCVLGPYDDGIPGNPVGELQELCMNRRMPPPAYEVSMEEGQPHERMFVMNCIVNKHKESGKGKSKKLAKRQAAHKMLNRLKDMPVENDEASFQLIDEDDLAQGIEQMKVAAKGNGMKAKGQPHGMANMTRIYKNLKTDPGTKMGELHTGFDKETMKPKALTLLEEISKEQNFDYTFIDIDEKSKSGKIHCLLQLSLVPVAVCYGTGTSKEDARSDVAFNTLEYLRIMTR